MDDDKKPDEEAALGEEAARLALFVDALETKFGDKALAVARRQAALAKANGDGVAKTWRALAAILKTRQGKGGR